MEILFVCMGNTCRSQMAEIIFNSLVDDKIHNAFSAGIRTLADGIVTPNTVHVVEDRLKVDIKNKKVVQLTSDLVEESDLVLSMTKEISDVVAEVSPKSGIKIHSLSEYINGEEVVDPFGGNVDTYNLTFDKLKTMIDLLIIKLMEDEG